MRQGAGLQDVYDCIVCIAELWCLHVVSIYNRAWRGHRSSNPRHRCHFPLADISPRRPGPEWRNDARQLARRESAPLSQWPATFRFLHRVLVRSIVGPRHFHDLPPTYASRHWLPVAPRKHNDTKPTIYIFTLSNNHLDRTSLKITIQFCTLVWKSRPSRNTFMQRCSKYNIQTVSVKLKIWTKKLKSEKQLILSNVRKCLISDIGLFL